MWKIPFVISLLLARFNHAASAAVDTSPYNDICGVSYPSLTKRGHNILQSLIPHTSKTILTTRTTPQHVAFCWIVNTDKKKVNAGPKMLQRYALAVFYLATAGDKWIESTNWLTVKDECAWFGVTCNRWKRVTILDLPFNAVDGIIPRDIKLLTSLTELDLKANDLQGVLPATIGDLKSLTVLKLCMNGIFGNIPVSLGKLKNLKMLNLYGNFLMGKIPKALGDLGKLEYLDLYANSLTGGIPTELGKLKNLKELYLNENGLAGTISRETGKKLNRLTELWADCRGSYPEVKCDFCSVCCKDAENPRCHRLSKNVLVK